MPYPLWRIRRADMWSEEIPRERNAKFGECVQWEIGGRWQGAQGERWWLIVLFDTATSHAVARFTSDASAKSQLSVLELWLRKYGRMSVCCTARRSFFQWSPESGIYRSQEGSINERSLTQIGRALQELNIAWTSSSYIAAEGELASFVATMRCQWKERQWQSGQPTLQQANAWIESEFLPLWRPGFAAPVPKKRDAHRTLEENYDLTSILSHVRISRIRPDLTLQVDRRLYAITEPVLGRSVAGATVRVEMRSGGVLAIRFQDQYLRYKLCDPAARPVQQVVVKRRTKAANAGGRSSWNNNFWLKRGPTLYKAIKISNATS